MPRRKRAWLHARQKDSFSRQARQSDYRSRAVYKLIEIDQQDRLFRPGQTVVDLGAAPGSWSQYASSRVGPHGRVIAVDIEEIIPIRNVQAIRGDFSDMAVFRRSLDVLGGAKADLVISDMAPHISGIRVTDQARSMYLAELVCDFACHVLKPGSDLLVKLFQGEGTDEYRQELVERFQRVMVRKPRASRDTSREFYVLARGYKV
ncbi:MAG: RlmE family RNA methyltransferase [Gammaproteobacteria bacterium]|nr:RlmE family RNA methyltransferase [Gammaproteobacteria bacterium]